MHFIIRLLPPSIISFSLNPSTLWPWDLHAPPLCSLGPSTFSPPPLNKRKHLWRGCQASPLAAPCHNPPPVKPSASAPWWWTVSEGPLERKKKTVKIPQLQPSVYKWCQHPWKLLGSIPPEREGSYSKLQHSSLLVLRDFFQFLVRTDSVHKVWLLIVVGGKNNVQHHTLQGLKYKMHSWLKWKQVKKSLWTDV